MIGDCGDAHFCCFGRSNAGERVLDHKAFFGRDPKFLRRAQVDVGSGFAAFNFFTSNNDLERIRSVDVDLKRVAQTR